MLLRAPARGAIGSRPVAGGTRSKIVNLAPPLGGWNARDATPEVSAVKTANGQQPEAIILDNWIPDIGGLRVRRGYSSWATGLSGNYVESLFEYAPKTGTNKFFAATPTIIYDVSSSGAGSSSVTSMTNGRWQHAMLSNASGSYLYICNGADDPRYYDGSSWTGSSFSGSGLTIANLINVHVHMNRLWFIEKNTFNAWYAPTSSISGTLVKFDLGGLFKKGGSLLAMGSWTRDGGTGPDDLAVFITTKGEVALYSGTDPSSATTAQLVGVFSIPYPIGRRCIHKSGADIAILTSLGMVSGQQILSAPESAVARVTATTTIAGAFRSAYSLAGTSHGWQIFEHPNANLVWINVPATERSVQYQFVMNTETGAWCRFTGLNAGVWGLFNGLPYFGGNDGKVYRFDDDYSDNGSNIVAIMQTAFTNFRSPNRKRFVLARPLFLGAQGYAPVITIKTDYDISATTLATVAADTIGSAWDLVDWDTAVWGAGSYPLLPFEGLGSIGVAGSLAFSVATSSELVFNGADIVYEEGGLL
jgi:hypothetical protein